MVSRLRRPKRPEDLLAAASLLSLDDSSDRLRIVFVGGGPLERGLRDQTHRMGLGTRVTLLGDRLDVPELMPDIDVVVLASSAEGMPYSILEAMAAGKPVVGSRVPGIADLIREGETGYGYTLGEPQELAGVLRALLGDADLRRRLGAAGRRTVAKSYSVKRMVRETENLYRMLVMGRAPALSNHP
jgi:glycosyltransferase involved in cell wall biosynthesis